MCGVFFGGALLIVQQSATPRGRCWTSLQFRLAAFRVDNLERLSMWFSEDFPSRSSDLPLIPRALDVLRDELGQNVGL